VPDIIESLSDYPISQIVINESAVAASFEWFPVGTFRQFYFWAKRGDPAQAINGLYVAYDESPPAPKGWEKVAVNLGTVEKPVYLWLQRDGHKNNAVVTFSLVGDVKLCPEKHKYLSTALNPAEEDSLVYVCFGIKLDLGSEKKFQLGDEWDVKDGGSDEVWRHAVVKALVRNDYYAVYASTQVYMQYIGFPRNWSDWVPRVSPKIAPLFSHSGCKWTGKFSAPFQPHTLVDIPELFPPEAPVGVEDYALPISLALVRLRQLELNIVLEHLEAGRALTEAEKYFLTGGKGFQLARKLLHCRVEAPHAIEVQTFLSGMALFAIKAVTEDAWNSPRLVQLFSLIMLSDPDFCEFYSTHGLNAPASYPGGSAIDPSPKISGYVLGFINQFAERGGLEKINALLFTPTKVRSFKKDLEQLTLLGIARRFVRPEVFAKVFQDFQAKELFISLIRNLTNEQLRGIDKASFRAEIQTAANSVLSADFTSEQLTEFRETCDLELILRALKSGMLEQTIQAMIGLIEIINGVTAPPTPAAISPADSNDAGTAPAAGAASERKNDEGDIEMATYGPQLPPENSSRDISNNMQVVPYDDANNSMFVPTTC